MRTKEICNILIERDGYTKEEAMEIIQDVKTEMEDAIACGDFLLAEEIFTSDLGLELDYLI